MISIEPISEFALSDYRSLLLENPEMLIIPSPGRDMTATLAPQDDSFLISTRQGVAVGTTYLNE